MSLFDEKVLRAAGSAWDDPLGPPPGWLDSPAANVHREAGAALIEAQFPEASTIVVKDPRICRLAPLWSSLLEGRGIEPRFALVFRHPAEVADSLAARDGFAAEKSLLLWLAYVLDSELHTRAHRRALISFDRLLSDWRGAIADLGSALALPLQTSDPGVGAAIDEFLCGDRRHHRHSADDEPGSPVDRWAADAHRALLDGERSDGPELGATMDRIRSELAPAAGTFGPVLRDERRRRIEAEEKTDLSREARRAAQRRAERARESAREAAERAELEADRARAARRELGRLRGSRSWRLTAPLRRASALAGGRRRDDEPEAPAPFVVGVGRSGTTLLRLMLDAHPDLAVPPETRFVPRLIRAARKPGATPDRIVALLEAERNWSDFGLDADAVRERLPAAESLGAGAAVRAFFRAYAARFGKSRWGDKTPPYGSRMPLISGAVPEARFVHVIRDARDVAASWQAFRERRGDDPLTAAHWAHVWVATIVETRVRARDVPHYLEVRYEDLVAAPEATLRGICEWIALPYDARMLSYHLSAEERLGELASGLPSAGGQPARTGEDRIAPHELTTKPPQRDRVGAWRDALSEQEVADVEAVAGELLADVPRAASQAPRVPPA